MDKRYIVGFLTLIIYTPFVFLGFYFMMSVLSNFKSGKLMDFIMYIGNMIKSILINPLIHLYNFIIKMLPFNVNKGKVNEKDWIWHNVNLTQTLFLIITLGLLSLGLYFLIKPYKLPNFFNEYFKTSMVVTSVIYFSLFVMFYVLFSKTELSKEDNKYPYNNKNSSDIKWLFKRTQDYRYNIIITSLIITFLGLFSMYLFKHPEYLTNISLLVKIFSGITIMFILYNTLKEIPFIKNLLNKNVFKFIYEFIFIIPCLFYMLADYLYIQTRLTPQYVYYILAIQIIIVSVYIIKPIIESLIYTKTHDSTQKGIVSNQIESNKQTIEKLQKKINTIENYTPKTFDKNKQYNRIPSYEWDNIIKYGIGNSFTKDDIYLMSILENHGYKGSDDYKKGCRSDLMNSDCEATTMMLTYIYKNIHNVITYKEDIESLRRENDKLEKKQKKMTNITSGVELVKNPMYLNVENTVGASTLIDKLNQGKPRLLYNYCLSTWVFIHERGNNFGNQYKEFTNILNFKNRPRISVNVHKKELLVTMENKSGDDFEYTMKNIELQKWNNVVVNYDGGILDIYMNGNLVSSSKNVLPKIEEHANIIIGQNNGVSGGICNVLYFPTTISHNRIKANYKMLKNRNPPVV
tara:strand:- start:792 stop:2687 length:1896 start_codon:yes stop_codon:yes gene_type:complete